MITIATTPVSMHQPQHFIEVRPDQVDDSADDRELQKQRQQQQQQEEGPEHEQQPEHPSEVIALATRMVNFLNIIKPDNPNKADDAATVISTSDETAATASTTSSHSHATISTSARQISSTSEVTDDLSAQQQKPHVSFGTVHVRHYERVIGNHPDVHFGIPLGIGWSYVDDESVELRSYHRSVQHKGCYKLSRQARRKIFHEEVGLSQEQTRAIEMKLDTKRKNQRKMTGKLWNRIKSRPFAVKVRVRLLSYSQPESL
uniref:Uncharacterized protein n=1 Tax=Craspedostauros australis TaxID=1486917 RepID=A0A7R9ZJC8_9STRA|mmetsp:Transcript_13075/g.36098  ORF Transcript_13075/g.36098 Transcript_13075/m.36098 type:complete len:259 (+) Transcript_13075:386-1162(+)|eukprot:CAMPEP_0198118534 /NCGR_PEP_ID=MMETSP1442-20131203/22053_1 /TAXON_ID= /ORGANISM="Craspedostauros australis, Strain CCMP3328" /LENGTH=258 /DNA_ID=CAMNT_0043776809 /DNA_START=283 /DNA_END=1059 /DNA_ORIENTATION=+